MLNAIRNNDFAAMYKYEDIMINLDELMMNHKRNTQYEGRVKAAMKERHNTLEYKRQDILENLHLDIVTLGIFNDLSSTEIKKMIKKVVENQSMDFDYTKIKEIVIMDLIERKRANVEIVKGVGNTNRVLLNFKKYATEQHQHIYEVLKLENYIKNPLEEILYLKVGE